MVLKSPLFLQAATGDVPISESAADWRGLVDALVSVDGVIRSTDLAVTQRGAGANMSVDVSSGQVAVTGGSVSFQGTYMCQSTATVNVPISAAPGSGSRTDLIVAQVYDSQADGSGQYSWTPLAVTGTVGGGVPATPASSLALAKVAVTAGQASVLTANITNLRIPARGLAVPLIQSGTMTVTYASGVATGTITFPQAYTATPVVVLTVGAITGNTATAMNTTAVTTTSFTYRSAPSAGGTYSGTITGSWIAIGS